jgi:hypothetical protein
MTCVKLTYGPQVWYFGKFLNQLQCISEHDVRKTGLIPGGQNIVIAVFNHRKEIDEMAAITWRCASQET